MVRLKDLISALAAQTEETKDLAKSKYEEPETAEEKKIREVSERLFHFVGRYVVLFQEIEARLDQIILLLIGHDKWHLGTNIVSRLSHSEKIDLIHSTVATSKLHNGTDAQRQWLVSFDQVIGELRTENSRRNKIVHSLYLFEAVEFGAPVLRSKRTKKAGLKQLDQEYMNEGYMAAAIGKVAELVFDVGMLKQQLIAWDQEAVTADKASS